MQKITLIHRVVYGNNLYYPYCDISRLIISLMTKKTFTPSNVKVLQAVYDVNYKSDNPLA